MKPLIAANWKMNKTRKEIDQFFSEFLKMVPYISSDREVVIIPTFVYIPYIAEKLMGTAISYGAQNVFYEEKGAFTGEISPLMLRDLGCTYVVIGHSERRKYFCETDETVNLKVKKVLELGMRPIVCIGETLEERENNKTFEVIEKQVQGGLEGIKISSPESLVIAYEPIWAIGTGKTATPQQAEEVHRFIRKLLGDLFKDIAGEIRILYGGSVKPENVAGLMEMENINGALVGGASLDPVSFYKIIRYEHGGNE